MNPSPQRGKSLAAATASVLLLAVLAAGGYSLWLRKGCPTVSNVALGSSGLLLEFASHPEYDLLSDGGFGGVSHLYMIEISYFAVVTLATVSVLSVTALVSMIAVFSTPRRGRQA